MTTHERNRGSRKHHSAQYAALLPPGRFMRRICFAALALVSTAAFAETPYEARFVSQWVAHCQAPSGPYQLNFRSASGDATNDDMSVSIKVGEGPSVPVPLKQALFFAGRIKSRSQGQCDNVSTVSFPTGNTLLLIQRDGRPWLDSLSAVLIRAKDGTVLDTVFDLAAQPGLAELSEHAGKVRVKLVREWPASKSQTEETAPIIGWLELSDVDGKIKSAWK